MTEHIIASSVMICAVLLLRAILRNKAPNRLIYALWAVVFIRLVVPGTLFDIRLPNSSEHYVSGQEHFINDNFVLPNETPSTSVETETNVPNKTETAPNKKNRIDYAMLGKTVYIVGAASFFVWFALSEISVKRKLTLGRIYFKKVGRTKVFINDSDIVPCVFGIKPSIYITDSIANSENLDLVLQHEMTHIKHFDSYRAMVRRALVAVYWWNPLIWLYMILASRDAELACDEAVAMKLDERSRLSYAKMIFEYAPRAKSPVPEFGGKPMKKRITAITKNTRFSKTAIVLAMIISIIVCAFGFVGCDESEPLPEGVSSVPDVPEESLVDSETGEIKWPAELLPEGFPVPEYTEIYSAERKDNEVIIVMFAEDKKRPVHYTFENDLHFKYGYRTVMDLETGDAYWLSRDGYKFTVISSMHPNTHLTAINEKSPTGYTYEIRLSPADVKIDSLFWQYPDANTDLGLEEKVYEDWDESIFPENFPKPTEGLTIVSIEQKSNGVFLTLKGTSMDESLYLQEIYRSGFYHVGVQPWRNENGDYFFQVDNNFGADPDVPVTFYLQICKYNDKVVK